MDTGLLTVDYAALWVANRLSGGRGPAVPVGVAGRGTH